MNIELPTNRPYGGMFAMGNRRAGNDVQEIASIIVRAGYLLESTSGPESHRMMPDPDAAGSALSLTDQLSMPPSTPSDLVREADIAPYKPVADIVVEEFLDGFAAGAELRVDGTTWLTREASVPGPAPDAFFLADRNRHLFGYQPRTLEPRRGEAGTVAPGWLAEPIQFEVRELTLADVDRYSERALNFHRRGGGFVASAAIKTELSAGWRVSLRRLGTGNEPFSVTLAFAPLYALYRTYCGHGPDKPPYWTRVRLGPMRADTLILRPAAGRAHVLWRATWPWADQPAERYRALRVTEGSA